jgi:hypothetical protein
MKFLLDNNLPLQFPNISIYQFDDMGDNKVHLCTHTYTKPKTDRTCTHMYAHTDNVHLHTYMYTRTRTHTLTHTTTRMKKSRREHQVSVSKQTSYHQSVHQDFSWQ